MLIGALLPTLERRKDAESWRGRSPAALPYPQKLHLTISSCAAARMSHSTAGHDLVLRGWLCALVADQVLGSAVGEVLSTLSSQPFREGGSWKVHPASGYLSIRGVSAEPLECRSAPRDARTS